MAQASEPRVGETAGSTHHPDIDWEAVEASPEFQELVRRRRGFVVPATIFFLVWYLGFIILAGYAEDFMGESIYQGFTVGYALALTQFVMVWGLAFWYLKKADREFEPLERKAAERAGAELDVGAERQRAADARPTIPVSRPRPGVS